MSSKQDKFTRSARGQQCQIRQQNVCNHNPETVVLAHLNGAGWGKKADNIHAAFACAACHAWLDGGYVKTHSRDQRDLAHLQGVVRTQEIWRREGLL